MLEFAVTTVILSLYWNHSFFDTLYWLKSFKSFRIFTVKITPLQLIEIFRHLLSPDHLDWVASPAACWLWTCESWPGGAGGSPGPGRRRHLPARCGVPRHELTPGQQSNGRLEGKTRLTWMATRSASWTNSLMFPATSSLNWKFLGIASVSSLTLTLSQLILLMICVDFY